MNRKWMLSIIICTVFGLLALYLSPSPIMLNIDNIDDVCGTRSMITSDNVPLHIRPSTFSLVQNRLKKNLEINVCTDTGEWSAVILSEERKNCKIPYDLQKGSYEYSGPCEFGWVRSKFLQMIAG